MFTSMAQIIMQFKTYQKIQWACLFIISQLISSLIKWQILMEMQLKWINRALTCSGMAKQSWQCGTGRQNKCCHFTSKFITIRNNQFLCVVWGGQTLYSKENFVLQRHIVKLLDQVSQWDEILGKEDVDKDLCRIFRYVDTLRDIM